MNDTCDQHAGHNPPTPPKGARHDAHRGGNAASRTKRRAVRPIFATRATMGARLVSGSEAISVSGMIGRLAHFSMGLNGRLPVRIDRSRHALAVTIQR